MLKNSYTEQFAETLATSFKQVYPTQFDQLGEEQVFNSRFILSGLEKPKDPSMGRFAFPVFKYARLLGEKPQEIASKVAQSAQAELNGNGSLLAEIAAAGAYINGRTSFEAEAGETIREVLSKGSDYGQSEIGAGHRVLVEYSSVNIAKPFGIGHLRTTILGNALRRVFLKLGYDTMGINYLGDWGTQFGKMIVAYSRWGESEEPSIAELMDLYVKFHVEAEKDPQLDEQAREEFKKLEDGNKGTEDLWQRFKTISLKEFDRVYKKMRVEFDWITGESFLNDKMEEVIARLEKAGLTSISEGALVVELHDPQLPPCLLRKADGATLYATRDIAGLLYRWKTYPFDEMLYVVGSAQSDHFKQVFKVVEMLEEAENTPPEKRVTGKAKHIEFGWVKFGDQAMATRKGTIILLDNVLDRAIELAREKIREKNPDLKNFEETAAMIGIGAVMFSQLSVRRQKDINFDWDEVLNFEGETGPYLQYTHARLRSLLRNFTGEISASIDMKLLECEEEKRVLELLADYPDAIVDAARSYEPNLVSTHLLKLAGAFNKVYQRKDDQGRIDRIISDDPKLSAARIAFVRAVQIVIGDGLALLGMQAPEEM
ncbi:MAG TPA: arginine--tRNA ligase [candidate division Zixibacteria bacterium]|nr:arginine--tRNA ligase [candidate division Zixibacteria bacterium]